MTVRRWMIVVVAVAAVLAVWIMLKRSAEFSRLAVFHGEEEKRRRHFYDVEIEILESLEREHEGDLSRIRKHRGTSLGEVYLQETERNIVEAEECRVFLPRLVEQIDYHAELRRKYERAAIQPWISVAPDQPEPRWPHEYEPLPGFGPTMIHQ
jgi:hypothetical protein